jgi:AcrR family transcriptional regulator
MAREEQGDATITKRPRTPRVRGEQQRAIDTREKIIDAAESEFAERGYEGASTREIARVAGAQHTMISYHFSGKDGLWQAVIDRLTGEFTARQKERFEGLRGVDNRAKLRLLLEEFIRYSAANLNLHKLMTLASTESSPRLEKIVTDYLSGYFTMISGLIKEVQNEGGFVEGDPDHLHYLFIGAATRIFMQSHEVARVIGRSPLEPDFVDIHVDRCLGLFFR